MSTQRQDNGDQDLSHLRQQIDAIDNEILLLLNQRAKIAQEVGEVKAKDNLPICRPERESQVLRRLFDKNAGPLISDHIQFIFREIISACRALERRMVVAFLGPTGTFSEQAVHKQFGHSIEFMPCATIDEVFLSTESGAADFGVVPIENSIEGAINRTLDLLLQTPLSVSGEVAIPVQHHLMSKNGTMEGVHKICAHSQALAQCQTWLNLHYPHVEQVAVSSNAEAARMARDDATLAAIASSIAGQEYDLVTIHAHIQDDPHNRTRFAVIGQLKTTPSGKDQTSMILASPNKAGAVYQLLAPLSQHGVSMTRFESRPARTGNWEYFFYVDVEGHQMEDKVKKAIDELRNQAAFFKVLGSYPCVM